MKQAVATVFLIVLVILAGCQTISKPSMPPEQSSMVLSAESTVQTSSEEQDKTFVIESAEGASQLGKVGISDKKEDTAALLAKMEDMQSFMYDENSNRLLRFGFGQEPERVSVRYILGDGEEKPYPYANETIVVPNMKGMYFVFVEVTWKDNTQTTANFTIDILWEGQSQAGYLKDLSEMKSKKSEFLPAAQEILEDYKSGKVYSYNKNEINYDQFPEGYDFPSINTVDDFTVYGIDNYLGAVSVGVPLGKKGDVIMLFGMDRYRVDKKIVWGAINVAFEAASTRRLRMAANDFMITLQSYIAFSIEKSKVSVVCQEDFFPYKSTELTYLECLLIVNGDSEHPVGYLNAIPVERYEEFLKLDIPKEKRGIRIADYNNQLVLTAAVQNENIARLSDQDRENAEALAGLLKKLQEGTEAIETVCKVQ